MELNLGCGRTHKPGMINADFVDIPGYTDVVFDAQNPWPFPPDTFTRVEASHVFEHLPNWQGFLDAAWESLRDGHALELRMPHGANACAWMDVTHVRPWYPLSFVCVQPGYHEESRNGQYRESRERYWEITRCLVVVSRWVRTWHKALRWLPGLTRTRWTMHMIALYPHLCEEICITLRPLKTPDAVTRFLRAGRAGHLEVQYVAHEGGILRSLVGTEEYMGGNIQAFHEKYGGS